MEAMLGISLCSYLYLKLAKMLCFSYYVLCFLLNKIGEEEGEQLLSGSRSEDRSEGGGGDPNDVYTCR
jgi:hypothetical protein